MARRQKFKEPFDTGAAEDWIRRREAIRLADQGPKCLLHCKGRRWGPFTSRTDVTHVVVDGQEYRLRYPVRLRNDVQYVVDIVDGIASFEVDIAIDANWHEPIPAQSDRHLKDRRARAR